MEPLKRQLNWLAIFAVAMACVEAAVVVYLRFIYYPQGFDFPLVIILDRLAAIEIGREAATLVMLLGVSMLAGGDRWERFLLFCYGFGLWDIFYYVWLLVFLRWPPSLLTYDVLFLIPVPWIGPVLAPLIVSLCLVAAALILLRLRQRGVRLVAPASLWGLAAAGGGLVLLSFMIDFRVVLQGLPPPPFNWWTFSAGIGLGIAALALGVRRSIAAAASFRSS